MVQGRLTVMGPDRLDSGRWRWWCLCSCGNLLSVHTGNLKKGSGTVSCGCARRERIMKLNTKHGCAGRRRKTAEYHAWQAMRERCYNPNYHAAEHYAGRGIVVCDRWRDSFENFLSDMGERPSLSLSLERIDNDGNYEPNNCKWATRSEQNRNQRHWLRCGKRNKKSG